MRSSEPAWVKIIDQSLNTFCPPEGETVVNLYAWRFFVKDIFSGALTKRAALSVLEHPEEIQLRIDQTRAIIAANDANQVSDYDKVIAQIQSDTSIIPQIAERLDAEMAAVHAATAELHAASQEVAGSVRGVAETIEKAVLTKIKGIENNTSTRTAVLVGLGTGIATWALTTYAPSAVSWLSTHQPFRQHSVAQTSQNSRRQSVTSLSSQPAQYRISIDEGVPKVSLQSNVMIISTQFNLCWGGSVRPASRKHLARHAHNHRLSN